MNLPCRQRRLLREIDDAVCRSDPRLASMLAIFGRLTAAEEMPGHEQLRTLPLRRVWAALVAAAGIVATLIACGAGLCARLIGSAVTVGTAVAVWMARHRPAGRQASPGSSAAGTRADAGPSPPGPPRL